VSGVGEALIELLLQSLPRASFRTQDIFAWVADTAEPPPGVWLEAEDGSAYTGIVVVQGNRPRLMLALRAEPPRRRSTPEAPYRRPVDHGLPYRSDEDDHFP
jgi:hypothetical protein